jgi:hypothetical protein
MKKTRGRKISCYCPFYLDIWFAAENRYLCLPPGQIFGWLGSLRLGMDELATTITSGFTTRLPNRVGEFAGKQIG